MLIDKISYMKERQKEWKLLDNYRRRFFLKYEFKKIVSRSLLNNRYALLIPKYVARIRFSFITTKASTNKQRNRCVISGREHNVLSKVQYSRFVFRDRATHGALPGVSRLSR